MDGWLEKANDELVAQLTKSLLEPKGSFFRVWGEGPTQELAKRTIASLREDAASTEDNAMRKVLGDLVDETVPKGLGFYDVRLFARAVRKIVVDSMDAHGVSDLAKRRRVEDWLHQIALTGPMFYGVQRERAFQEQAVELEVKPLEKQIAELHAAYAEKTQLLNLLREVSTPIVPLYKGILLAPLVGTIDTTRAYDLNEKLLRAVIQAKAKFVILDISGVPLFDTTTAEHFLRTAGAAKLMGAEIVVVGLSPEVAQTIVGLGIDLSRIRTHRTLEDGFVYALQKLGYLVTTKGAN
mgnify:CR=1 FL=1